MENCHITFRKNLDQSVTMEAIGETGELVFRTLFSAKDWDGIAEKMRPSKPPIPDKYGYGVAERRGSCWQCIGPMTYEEANEYMSQPHGKLRVIWRPERWEYQQVSHPSFNGRILDSWVTQTL